MPVRIRNAPAVVEWIDTSSNPRSFLHLGGLEGPSLQLQLHYDDEKQTAIFKIRVLLNFREGTVHQAGDYLYLWIHPGDVVLLLQDAAHRLQDGASILRGPTTCLRLVLSTPASVVAPSDFSLPPRESRGFQTLNSLVILAKQSILTIYIEQRMAPDPEKLQQLCQALCNGSVKRHPGHDLRDFYEGRDAMIIKDLGHFAGSDMTCQGLTAGGPGNTPHNAVTPPPYTEARPPPSPSIFAQRPAEKRQRITAQETPEKRQRATDLIASRSPDITTVYTTLLAQQTAQMETFFSFQRTQMAKVLELIGARVETMPAQVTRRVDRHVREEMARIWDKRPHEWEQVTQAMVQEEVEDALERSLPQEMEKLKECLKEECLDDLKDVLEGGLVSITLPR
ncbi:hypothetical protein DHEL01_v210574 [Diaporthe helianthi]|uniref:Uncharacterized protein n=1 Tax=Diaporthe helianthi TaxID=158607 RepID=A0A2P5HL93_DIAHE|nr:hypothetical protein DHEL01_v210574 [Diaporthe helianthi]